LLFVNIAFSQNQSNDKRTLLTIGDEKTSVSDFLRIYQKNNVQTEVIDQKSLDEYLELYINFKLKVKEAEDLGLDTLKSFIDELGGYRTQLTKPYFIDEEVNQKLLEEAYNRKTMDLRASHILIKVSETAMPEDTLQAYNKILEIRNQAIAGKDFGDLAEEHSEDPSSRDMEAIPGKRPFRKGNRGDLGYFTVFDMVYQFENGAYNTELDQVSEIIRTQFGYHIIKVSDKKAAMGSATVAHIFKAVPADAKPEDAEKAHESILSAYEELKNGSTFEMVAKKYSDDRGSKEKGGELPPFGVNRMVPEFIAEISQIENPGDFSKPVLTQYGWHIIKLIELNPPAPFDKEESKLKDRLQRDARSHKSKTVVIDRVKKDYKFKEYPKNKKELFATLDSTILQKKWNADTAKEMKKVLFKIGKDKYTQNDFAKYLNQKQKRDNPVEIAAFYNRIYNTYVEEKLLAFLDGQLEKLYPDFGALMKEYRDGILLFDLTDQKVWSKAVKDTVGLDAFHQAHLNDYVWGERLQATVFTIMDSTKVDKIREKAINKVKPANIADVYKTDSLTVMEFESGFYAKGQNPYIDQIEWKEGLSKNLKDNDNNTVFVLVEKITNKDPKSLNESRGIITADYQNHLEKEWIKELRSKYTIKVNKKVLSSIK
jgi:peptidyl-prolyl cis-trans isomerase SurA